MTYSKKKKATNHANCVSLLSRAIERNEKIEIEYSDKNGEIKNFKYRDWETK